jgi:DNA-binding CsgD family transcriptional regulator
MTFPDRLGRVSQTSTEAIAGNGASDRSNPAARICVSLTKPVSISDCSSVEGHQDAPFSAWWLTIDEVLTDLSEQGNVIIFELRLLEESGLTIQWFRRVNNNMLIMGISPQSDPAVTTPDASTSLHWQRRRMPSTLSKQLANPPRIADNLDIGSREVRPKLSARERDVLIAYASGMTLEAVARLVGIRLGTAKTYLGRIKAKYHEVGRPARTKLDLATRVREDWR